MTDFSEIAKLVVGVTPALETAADAIRSARFELAALLADPNVYSTNKWPVENRADALCLEAAYGVLLEAEEDARAAHAAAREAVPALLAECERLEAERVPLAFPNLVTDSPLVAVPTSFLSSGPDGRTVIDDAIRPWKDRATAAEADLTALRAEVPYAYLCTSLQFNTEIIYDKALVDERVARPERWTITPMYLGNPLARAGLTQRQPITEGKSS